MNYLKKWNDGETNIIRVGMTAIETEIRSSARKNNKKLCAEKISSEVQSEKHIKESKIGWWNICGKDKIKQTLISRSTMTIWRPERESELNEAFS